MRSRPELMPDGGPNVFASRSLQPNATGACTAADGDRVLIGVTLCGQGLCMDVDAAAARSFAREVFAAATEAERAQLQRALNGAGATHDRG